MNKHREIIYNQRRKVLEIGSSKDKKDQLQLREMVMEKIHADIETILISSQTESKALDYERIADDFFSIVPFDEKSRKSVKEQIEKLSEEEKIKEFLMKIVNQVYEAREKQYGEEVSRQIEKLVLSSTMDSLWINHLQDIDYLREGVGLRGYAAKDPLVEYKGEAFKLFEDLMRAIDYEVVHRIFKIQLVPQGQQTQPHNHQHEHQHASESGSTSTTSSAATNLDEPAEALVPTDKKKIGRNDPCPCGAINPDTGKPYKYKKCGMINAPYHKGN